MKNVMVQLYSVLVQQLKLAQLQKHRSELYRLICQCYSVAEPPLIILDFKPKHHYKILQTLNGGA